MQHQANNKKNIKEKMPVKGLFCDSLGNELLFGKEGYKSIKALIPSFFVGIHTVNTQQGYNIIIKLN